MLALGENPTLRLPLQTMFHDKRSRRLRRPLVDQDLFLASLWLACLTISSVKSFCNSSRLAVSVSVISRGISMSNANKFRQQAEEAEARVEWCEKKLLFERKRHKALKELAANEDWLDGKITPLVHGWIAGPGSGVQRAQ
jgi:hypothetical protein